MTFGTTENDHKAKKSLRLQDSHVSEDNKVWRKNELRDKTIAGYKELLDVIAKDNLLSSIIDRCVSSERLYFKLPKDAAPTTAADIDGLLTLIEELDKERSALPKLSSTQCRVNSDDFSLEDHISTMLRRCPILTTSLDGRLSPKYTEKSGNTLKTSPLNKKDAPSPTCDTIVFSGYASQYESRQFNGSALQRKRNSEAERGISGFCSLESEMGAMKMFRMKVLDADKLLLGSEVGHRTLPIAL